MIREIIFGQGSRVKMINLFWFRLDSAGNKRRREGSKVERMIMQKK
jgi:hypothetical protein